VWAPSQHRGSVLSAFLRAGWTREVECTAPRAAPGGGAAGSGERRPGWGRSPVAGVMAADRQTLGHLVAYAAAAGVVYAASVPGAPALVPQLRPGR
jgi:hypothetical protein